MPPVEGRSHGYQIQSQNPLLTTYPGDLGGKTGFTDAARHTFVTAAERGGRRLIVSLMDTENKPLRFPDQAVRLLDWGFAVPAGTDGVGTLVSPADLVASATTTAPRARRASPRVSQASATSTGFPVAPVALTGAALLVVAATVVGRRRAVRPAAASPGRAGEPPVRRPPSDRRPSGAPGTPAAPTGGSPSTPP
jgi:D-alanyl-D-alanine carboxypeptidase (penicillin-binding protein 5/6)